MKDRWKILIALAVFLAVFTGIWLVTLHVQPTNEVDAYKKLLREKGEKLEISEVVPPSVPSESNSVNAVEDAFRMFGSGSEKFPYAMKMVAPGKAMICCMQPDARGYDFTNSWDDFAAAIEADRPAIELLHQVLERPKLDFQLDYQKGAELLLPHLVPMKRAAQKLDAAVICEVHNGDMGSATTNILTLLAMVQRNSGEGLMISHLVRIAMASIAVAPTWELLQTTNITDVQLAAVQRGWEQIDFLSDATNVFVMERAWGIKEIQKARTFNDKLDTTIAFTASMSGSSSSSGSVWDWPPDWEAITEKPRYAIGAAMWRSSWSYSDELRVLKSDQIILDALRAMRINQTQFYKADCDTMTSRLSTLGITNAGAAFFRALKIPDLSEVFGDLGLSGVVLKTLRTDAACRVVVTAIALKRFQLKRGKFPETLDELVPEFLAAVPIDPYDGKPLRYHPNADESYLLYSVGEDGRDDGGDPAVPTGVTSSVPYWQNNHARDWVWPQPATPAEIQYYYEHPPK